MTIQDSFNNTDFDEFFSDYDVALAHGLSVSGEDKDYFARGRIAWLADRLQQLLQQPKAVMDFGCGTGSATPFLFDLIGTQSVVAIDTSAKCLDVAKRTRACEHAQFLLYSQYKPSEQIDLAYSNGTFHHIPPKSKLRQSTTSTVPCGTGALRALGEQCLEPRHPIRDEPHSI